MISCLSAGGSRRHIEIVCVFDTPGRKYSRLHGLTCDDESAAVDRPCDSSKRHVHFCASGNYFVGTILFFQLKYG